VFISFIGWWKCTIFAVTSDVSNNYGYCGNRSVFFFDFPPLLHLDCLEVTVFLLAFRPVPHLLPTNALVVVDLTSFSICFPPFHCLRDDWWHCSKTEVSLITESFNGARLLLCSRPSGLEGLWNLMADVSTVLCSLFRCGTCDSAASATIRLCDVCSHRFSEELCSAQFGSFHSKSAAWSHIKNVPRCSVCCICEWTCTVSRASELWSTGSDSTASLLAIGSGVEVGFLSTDTGESSVKRKDPCKSAELNEMSGKADWSVTKLQNKHQQILLDFLCIWLMVAHWLV